MKQSLIDFYLCWLNSDLPITVFADKQNLTLAQTANILRIGLQLHQEQRTDER